MPLEGPNWSNPGRNYSNLQCPARNRNRSIKGVRRGQSNDVRALLQQTAGVRNDIGNQEGIAVVKAKRSIVRYVSSRQIATGSPVPNGERPSGDTDASRKIIVTAVGYC